MKLLLEDHDEKSLEKRGSKDANFLFEKSDEGMHISIELEITDYALASLFISSFLGKDSDFFKAGVAPKRMSLIPTADRLTLLQEYMNKAMEELYKIKEWL